MGNRSVNSFHCKLDPFLGKIHAHNLNRYDVTDADDILWMLDEFIGHLGDMYQTILMNTDVDKCTKIDYVADGSL